MAENLILGVMIRKKIEDFSNGLPDKKLQKTPKDSSNAYKKNLIPLMIEETFASKHHSMKKKKKKLK